MNNKVRFDNFFDKGGFCSLEIWSDAAYLLRVSPIRYLRTKDDFCLFFDIELPLYVNELKSKYGIHNVSREILIRSIGFLLNGLVYKFSTGDIFEMSKRNCYVYATDKYYREIGG